MARALLAIAAAGLGVHALGPAGRHLRLTAKHPRIPGVTPRAAAPRGTPGAANCTENFYNQVVDHYNFGVNPTGTIYWQQRYLTYDRHWRNDTSGAIWAYVGNEADVSLYADHAGLMWENAQAAGAYLVFMGSWRG